MEGQVLGAGSHPGPSILKLILEPLASSPANSTAILSEVVAVGLEPALEPPTSPLTAAGTFLTAL